CGRHLLQGSDRATCDAHREMDGCTFEIKSSRFRWTDKPGGPITYIGDKAEFQNDFGAYTPVIYQCDVAADGKTVLAVRATAGRLPP
ncbi:hypothetical protein PQR02_40705, partial [Paraburkholderia sediminicola]